MVDSKLHDNRCIHELIIGQCAICLGLQDTDEEEKEWSLEDSSD